jgi:hypothetical protein
VQHSTEADHRLARVLAGVPGGQKGFRGWHGRRRRALDDLVAKLG